MQKAMKTLMIYGGGNTNCLFVRLKVLCVVLGESSGEVAINWKTVVACTCLNGNRRYFQNDNIICDSIERHVACEDL